MTRTIPGAADLAGKRIAILGLGISGRAALQALATHTQAILSFWDGKPEAVARTIDEMRAYPEVNAALEAQQAQSGTVSTDLNELLAWSPDVVVIAPAFRQTGPEWAALWAAEIEVWSEIELAWRLRSADSDGTFAPWLCITGTNGKTTTVTMLESILQAAGRRGMAVGNVGAPAVTAVSDISDDAPLAFAFELSSFQLAATTTMEPEASVCLNIDDDHLEWHHDRREYWAAKANVYNRTHVACLFPIGEAAVQEMVDEADVQEGARAIALSMGVPSVGQIGLVSDGEGSHDGIVVERAFIRTRHSEALPLFSLTDIAHLAPAGHDLPVHIAKDAMAAAGLARAIGVEPWAIAEGLRSFPAGAHRIELIETVDGVAYVDDSKATNAHAAKASLLAQREGSVVWIAGGQPKGSRFESLVDVVRPRLASVVVIGVDQEPWHAALDESGLDVTYVDPASTTPMDDAVRIAAAKAREGFTVLMAPACASMDQFTSYADRGEKFAEAVRALEGVRS